MLYFKIYWKI